VTTYKELLERARYLADQPPPPGKSPAEVMGYVFRQTDFDPYEQRAREYARLMENMPPMRWAPHADQSPDEPLKVAPKSALPRACSCGQTIWANVTPMDYDGSPICTDCVGNQAAGCYGKLPATLDARISEAQHDQDPTSDWTAWAHPSSEGP
jgi:hypothetical protein